MSQNESAGSIWAREHGAAVAQYCILLRTVAEVDRFFMFSATFPGLEAGTSYGIFRTGQPGVVGAKGYYSLPAAAAFATAARMTDQVGSKFVDRMSGLPACLTGLVFTSPVGSTKGKTSAVIAVWTHGTFAGMDRNRILQSVPISVALPADCAVTAGTGETLGESHAAHAEGALETNVSVTLEAMPTYFECDESSMQELEVAIRQAHGMPPHAATCC